MARSRVVNISNLQTFTAVNLLSDPGAIPGPVVIPQTAQITIGWLLEDGKLGHNVIYGRYAGGFAGTVAQANGILAALNTGSAWAAIAPSLATTTGILSVTIRDVNVANAPLIGSTGPGSAGTAAGAALPNEVSLVATLRTAKTGREFRGRVYVPGWATQALGAANVANAAAVAGLTTWANAISGALSAQGYTFVLGLRARAAYTSAVTGRVFPARAATTEPVTSIQVRDNHWDSQRRRGLK